MNRIMLGLCFLLLANTASSASDEKPSEERGYLYCKHRNFVNYDQQYTCTSGFGKTPTSACVGGVTSSIAKRDVDHVDTGYTNCNDGSPLTRVKLKMPDP